MSILKKRTALASFPRSGNTWIRFLIEETTGELSGSVYKDRIMLREGDGVVIKTHELDSSEYDRALHILRNPFDAIESYFHWKIDIAGKTNIDWHEHIEKEIAYWGQHTRHWLDTKIPIFRIRYEDFKQDPIKNLDKILCWLGYSCSQDRIEEVLIQSSIENMRKRNSGLGNQFFRQGNTGKGVNEFNLEEKTKLIISLKDILIESGYEMIVSEFYGD